jgi:hypothetical protein
MTCKEYDLKEFESEPTPEIFSAYSKAPKIRLRRGSKKVASPNPKTMSSSGSNYSGNCTKKRLGSMDIMRKYLVDLLKP